MKGVCLTIYTYEMQKHHGILLYEWLIEFAKKHDIPGASAIRAIAGYGRAHKLHEEHFLELASNVPVEVVIIADEKKIVELLELLKLEKVPLFYSKMPIEYNTLC